MKIAIVAHNIVKNGNGQGRANYEFVNYLITNGYKVHLYAHRVESELIDKVVFYPIKVIDKPVILKVAIFLVMATIKLLYRKYDIIYADSGTYLGYSHIICSHFCHKSYLNYKMRLYDKIYETFNSLVERFEYRKKATIIVVSEHLKQDLMSEYNIPSNKIKVVYNGVDASKNQISNPVRNSFLNGTNIKNQKLNSTTLLFVGDLSYRKGLDFLIEAMKGIDNVKLLIAGKIRNRYKQLAEGLNVEFLGFRMDIDKLLQKVDGFILPSLYDPFPVAVLEAMAIGLPVIISSSMGASEIIQDMENGLIIKDPTNANEIREKINLFASNPELMKKIGVKAYLTVKQIPWSKTVADKERLINTIRTNLLEIGYRKS